MARLSTDEHGDRAGGGVMLGEPTGPTGPAGELGDDGGDGDIA